jgi:hypothetical protein
MDSILPFGMADGLQLLRTVDVRWESDEGKWNQMRGSGIRRGVVDSDEEKWTQMRRSVMSICICGVVGRVQDCVYVYVYVYMCVTGCDRFKSHQSVQSLL